MRIKYSVRLAFTIYYILLTILYHYKIKHYFYWSNIADQLEGSFELSYTRLVIATIIFAINIYVIGKTNRNKLNFILLSLFFVILTVPSLITFHSANMYPVSLMIYHQLFFFILYFFSKVKLNFDGIPLLNKKQSFYLLLFLIAIGVLPYIFVYGPYINLKNLFLVDIYQTRRTMAGLSNAYFGYTYSPFTRIIIPLLIIVALEMKKVGMMVLGVLFLILFYLFGAHKTVYLGLIALLIFYRWDYQTAIRKVLKYSNWAIVICIFLALFNYDYPWILTFRRIHFLPALLDICYLDFFGDNPIYWSESVLSSFIEYPYESKHTYLIGQTYFNQPQIAANNGLISDGIMNFGGIGVLINIIVVAIYFFLLKNMNIPARYFGIYLLIVFGFVSSSTSTVLLTHGGIVLLLVSLFLLRENRKDPINSLSDKT